MSLRGWGCGLLLFILGFAARMAAQNPASWTAPFPPHHIAGNLYYVGGEELTAYLVVTPKGNILINSGFDANVPLIQKSIEELGFRFADTKILLISQGHNDHCSSAALVKKLTGAQYMVMDADVPVVESGGKMDFQYGAQPEMLFPPAKVDRVLHDGDTVALGGAVLTAHLTAGHNKGTTTWTMDEIEGGRTLHVVIVGGTTVNPGYKLVHNKAYPQIAADFHNGFQVLKSLPCDIFLGAHGVYYGLQEKYARWKAGDRAAFIDPEGYKRFVADRERAFEAELKRQQAGKP
ncbi:MAG: subclass B3 metallo-beta-lactamase [Terracidiphilus sp.]